MLIYKSLRWGDAFSYGPQNEIIFDKSPLTQIVAKNGSGKTSIASILEEIQYNKNSKGIKKGDILNRYSKSKTYWIELNFERDGDVYQAYSKRGSTQTLTLIKNGEDISAHTPTNTYKLLEEALGYDHKTFAQIVYQSSAASLGFLTATDSTRKKFLIDIFKSLGIYTQAGELYKNLVKDANTEVAKIKSAIAVIVGWLAKLEKENLEPMELVEAPADPEDLRKKVTALEIALRDIDNTNKLIMQNNQYKKILDSIEVSTTIPPIVDTTDLVKEIGSLAFQIKSAKTTIANNKSKATQRSCPTCGQSVDNSHAEKLCIDSAKVVEELTAKHAELSRQLQECESNNRESREIQAKITEWEKYHSLYKPNLPTELSVARDIATELNSIQDRIKWVEKGIATATAHNLKASAHNSRIEVMLSQKVDMEADLAKLNAEIKEAEQVLSTRQLLSKVFSTTGLLAYKVECLVKDLEEITNDYLVQMSDGRFQLGFQITPGSDKLDVVINDNGNDIDISALSGGELARVNISTLLGIRKLMQSISSTKTNLLFLDETIDNLDTDGKDKLVEVLISEEGLNTFIVSHGYTHPLLEQLSIIKENNISRIMG